MSTILLIDTATDVLTVALATEAGVQAVRSSHEPREHARCLLPWVDELLADQNLLRQDLDAVALDAGPGSFTGLRIGCAAAQGIAFALGIPVIPISSLAILAQMARYSDAYNEGDSIVAVLDARMGECYWQVFAVMPDGVIARGDAHVTTPATCLPEALKGATLFCGAGVSCLPASVLEAWGDYRVAKTVLLPQADALAALAWQALIHGETVCAEQATPLYVRDRVALTTQERADGAVL